MDLFVVAIEVGVDVPCIFTIKDQLTFPKMRLLNAQMVIRNSSLTYCSSAQCDHSVLVNFTFQNKIITIDSNNYPPTAHPPADLCNRKNPNALNNFFILLGLNPNSKLRGYDSKNEHDWTFLYFIKHKEINYS